VTDAAHFPRLTIQGVRVILQDRSVFADDWRARRAQVSRWTTWAPTGGRRRTDDDLSELRNSIIDIAARHGFPNSASQRELSAFDLQATIAFIELDLVPGPEALRDDVWAFLAAVLVPDVVDWRFGATAERYHGGVRNAFQRLWLRGVAFQQGAGPDRWEIVGSLSEDANVQILERPSLSGSTRVARAIGQEWLTLYRQPLGAALEAVMRRAAISLRITNQVLYLDALDEGALREEVSRHFQLAMRV
jgi:hypothetical protein